MNSIIIEYDLNSPGQNYDVLYKTIKEYGTYAHITESTWFIKTSASCEQVRDRLLSVIDKNDRLFTATLTGNAAWYNTLCDSQFIKDNL